MTSLQKGTLWAMGCLVFVFALSIGLSWYFYGYLDGETVAKMGLMLLPVMGAAAILLQWAEAEEVRKENRPSPKKPAARSYEGVAVRGKG